MRSKALKASLEGRGRFSATLSLPPFPPLLHDALSLSLSLSLSLNSQNSIAPSICSGERVRNVCAWNSAVDMNGAWEIVQFSTLQQARWKPCMPRNARQSLVHASVYHGARCYGNTRCLFSPTRRVTRILEWFFVQTDVRRFASSEISMLYRNVYFIEMLRAVQVGRHGVLINVKERMTRTKLNNTSEKKLNKQCW